MQVSKWGNSLAVRLPASVVEALQLKEGDDIEIQVAGARTFEVEAIGFRSRAAGALAQIPRRLPRISSSIVEANERG